MEKVVDQEVKVDVLIIGSEAAGAKAAIEAYEEGVDVLVVTKGLFGRSGDTIMAGWGIQAPIGHVDPRDNPDVFLEDVVKGGGYLGNQKLIERLTNLAVTEIPKMENWGAEFMKQDDKFLQFQLPGSSYPRTLRPIGLHGGLQWRKAYRQQFRRLKIKLMEEVFITDLLLTHGEVAGALGFSLHDGRFILFRAKSIILATGGCCQLYRYTDSSLDATGDGMAMAYRAGAELTDMEFQQFFPLCCYWPTAFYMSMITADLRYGLRGRFYNSLGEAFMERYLPLAKEWGLRDPTSRAIYMENMYGRGSPHGGAYLAVNHLPENLIDDWIKLTEPAYLPKLEAMGIDIKRHALETGPGAHYTMGGVRVNENCETSLPRLYAAGEVAAIEGAERIDGGPAITWCITMGYVTAKETAKKVKELDWLEIDLEQVKKERERVDALWERKQGIRGFEVKNKIKDIMWRHCALVRDGEGLNQALAQVQKIKAEDLPHLSVPGSSRVFNLGWVEALEAVNMTELAELTIRAALMREESRMAHYRTDFLHQDDVNWLKNIVIRKEDDKPVLTTAPPVITKIKPEMES